jgi:bifunctional oligoribonuclease and PAP phosphatase NrnA
VSEVGLEPAARLLRPAQNIAVIAHVNPDADAIGAVVGLTAGLRSMGKNAVAALSDPVPEYARFLTGADFVVATLDSHSFDVLVCADAASIERLGDLYDNNRDLFASLPILNVDHHQTNPLYGTVVYVEPAASSTSELCYRILRTLEAPLDGATADALMFGIVGDTGSFRNGATTTGALEAAGALLAHGADIQRIAFQLFESKRFAAARLWGQVIADIELDHARGIVIAKISQEMLRESGVTVDEVEGIAEYLRGIQEAETVILLKETAEGDVKVSMRSAVDVSVIASALGGGGHRQAAGCTVAGPLDVARQILISAYDLSHSE